MEPDAPPHAAVAYDLTTLTYPELLRANLRIRFPRARRPVGLWLASLAVFLLGCAGMGFLIGMATWPRFKPEPLAAIFALLGLALPYRVLMSVHRALKELREEGLCTTELTTEGVIRKTSVVEILYRWVPGQRISPIGDDILISVHGNRMLWLPRRAFATQAELDAFLEAGKALHSRAMAGWAG